jgi:glutamine synthetase
MDDLNQQKTLAGLVAASIGRPDFADRHSLDPQAREDQLAAILAQMAEAGIEVIRFSFVDTNGQLRTRPMEARHFAQAARNGVPFTTALFAMDSANHIFQPVFSADGGFGRSTMGGAGDMLAIADLSTFRILPWAKNCAIVLSDLYLTDGEPCPFDPRRVMRDACAALDQHNLAFVGGVEVECHIFKVTDPRLALEDCTQPARPADLAAYRHGYQYMSQLVLDEYEPIVDPIRRALIDLGLPLRTVECEWGPGQLEITLDPLLGVEAADAVILMRTAIKQVARRMGLMASFMTKPGLPNVFSCGWHLHESLARTDGSGNAFVSNDAHMSDIGRHFVGGLLEHVRAGTAFSNPTINGYKRLNANPLAPKRAVWSIDNKGAMCRLVGGAGDRSTHIENRSGEPLANPYLYMASQIFAGLDGIAKATDPGDPSGDPYGNVSAPLMPGSLMESIDALAQSAVFRETMGNEFVDHFVGMKRHEIGRFLATVTDWEHREYFEAF